MPEISTVRIADEDHRMSAIEGIYYKGARSCCSAAISTLGVEMGISIHLSGTFRELRKHVSVEELQRILTQFAEQMPLIAKWDKP